MNIYINNATKKIAGMTILDNVTLRLSSGKVYGLQGPNGSGKTMLMRLISGLIRPTSGAVYIDSQKIGQDMDFPDSIGLLIETPSFLPSYSGFQNLKLLAQIKGIIPDEKIKQTLQDVGLDPSDTRKFRKYSLGMKQRLGIASAIMEQPMILMLDEPTNALDNCGIEHICRIIKRERDRGALIILTCHDTALLHTLSDEIITVANGKVERR